MDQLKQLKIRHDDLHTKCEELEIERDSLKQALVAEQERNSRISKELEQVGRVRACSTSISAHFYTFFLVAHLNFLVLRRKTPRFWGFTAQ
jgi:hypothetical protein